MSETPAEVARRERQAWRETFGGGVVPFDLAYHAALREGATIAEAQARGVNAVLDAFTDRVADALADAPRA